MTIDEVRRARAADGPCRTAQAGRRVHVRVAAVTWAQLVALAVVVALANAGSGPAPALVRAGVVCLTAVLAFAWHEAGHVVVARALGLQVHAVEVRGVLDGGTVRQVAVDPHRDAAVILAGPAASVLLLLAGLVVVSLTADTWLAGRALVLVNGFVVLSSLTAGPRSDGVRAWRTLRTQRGTG